MKKLLIIILIVLFVSDLNAQVGAAINTTGATADFSAMLDVSSTNSGILIPRMTGSQKNAIISPATGLLIYQTDGAEGFWYFNGSVWLQSVGIQGPTGPTGADGATGATGAAGMLASGNAVGNTPYWDGNQWVVNSSNIFNNGSSVGIGTSSPDASAGLHIDFSDKGILIPRMTTSERNSIVNPAVGLQIFNTTTMCFEYFAYGIWQNMSCAVCPIPEDAGIITGSSVVCSGQNSVYFSVPSITNATSYIWSYSGTGATINGNSDSVNIDFSGSSTSGVLTVKGSNMCGDGVVSPGYSITVNNAPATPAAGTHTSTQTQIIWNWNSVSGSTGYKFNTINDFFTATGNGTNVSYVQSGLSCNTAYTLYVWAYNACGYSLPVTLTKTTSACFTCGVDNVNFTYNGSSVTYGTVAGQGNTCWLNRNLGATAVATAYDHSSGYGDLFQWGRGDDGHQLYSTATTSVLSTSDAPGHSKFIVNSNTPEDWRSPQNNYLWQGVSGTNNPCPTGWRLPTESELNSERLSWPSQDYYGAIASNLKFPAPGLRLLADGAYYLIGGYGCYWTSTVDGTKSRRLYFTSSNTAQMCSNERAYGMSVRCIRDN